MKKGKPYKVIIAILLFASAIVSFFLPYLHLPQQKGVEEGYVIDYKLAVQESKLINDIAKETGIKKSIVYSVAKNLVNGKDRESTKRRLLEEEYYVIDIVADRIEEMTEELEASKPINDRAFSYFDIIDISATIARVYQQDIISAILVIVTLIMTVAISIGAAVYILIKKGLKGYKVAKILTLINIVLSLLGLICINAIAHGALQVEGFKKENWGIGFFVVIGIQAFVLLIAIIGKLHEQFEGLVTWKMIFKQKQLIIMTIPFLVYGLVFYYGPLVGWTMAFQNYKPAAKDAQVWVAWDKFISLFTDTDFLFAFRNTVAMSLINLVLSFVFSIGFALLLNEVINVRGKKFVQTVSYLPHFLSWVIVAAIVQNMLSVDGGIINEFLVKFHIIDTPINFFANPKYFWWIVGFSFIWKETGWNSIIYLASITSINPDLYEAASIDGAGRFKKMLHITLPGIKATIFVLLIINLGAIMNSGFEAQYQLKNDIIKSSAEVIDTYVMSKSFFMGSDWSIGTAAGIFKSVISILLVSAANRTAKAFDQERLY